MIEVLWHGRGGQGAFTAARLLGAAASYADGLHSMAFPSFGPERRGAPMRAFTKISREPIGDRSAIARADFAVYLDDTLFSEGWQDELKPGGVALVNSTREFSDARIVSIDASGISEALLGRPIPNTALLGALAALGCEVSPDQVKEAIRNYMPAKLHAKNEAIVESAYDTCLRVREQAGADGAAGVAGEADGTEAASGLACGGDALGFEASAHEAFADGPFLACGAEGSTEHVSRETCARFPEALVPTLRQNVELDPAEYAHTTCFEGGFLVVKNAGWRNKRPVVDAGACTGCLQCYLYCPDGTIYKPAAPTVDLGADAAGADVSAGAAAAATGVPTPAAPAAPVAIDYDFCKGCGICASVCRFDALRMVPEQEGGKDR